MHHQGSCGTLPRNVITFETSFSSSQVVRIITDDNMTIYQSFELERHCQGFRVFATHGIILYKRKTTRKVRMGGAAACQGSSLPFRKTARLRVVNPFQITNSDMGTIFAIQSVGY